MSDVFLVALGGLSVLGVWGVFGFVRTHRAFKARECLYHSVVRRMQRGEHVPPRAYAELSSEDRAALEVLRLSTQTLRKPENMPAADPIDRPPIDRPPEKVAPRPNPLIAVASGRHRV